MELRHMKHFVVVAEELHFSRAAERLRISPPTLTEQIQNLERDLGVRLLHRTKRTVALTEAGSRFLEEARLTLRQAERAEIAAQQAGRGEVGRVEIGYVSSASCTGLLSQAIADYRRTHPMVYLNIRKIETPLQLEQLTEGHLDIGFLRPPSRYPLGISGLVISQQRLVLVLPTGHRLANVKMVLSSMLADESFIVPSFERDAGIYQHTAELGQQGGFQIRMEGRAPDFFTIVTMVASGFGIAVVPQSCSCIQIPGVVYRPLEPQQSPAELAAAFRRDERAPAVRMFIDQLRRMAKALKPIDQAIA
ncbi:MAG TPA: LysR substrate-binding domain-containing protein [Pseudolabrys sp.]|nr:LysR substrate-binding domain-containing protein [Pseudolabrys sp.]